MNNYRPNYCDLESYFELCDCYNQQLPGPLNSSIPQSYKPCKIHNSKPPANDSCNIHETESQISQSNTNADCDQNSSNPHPTDCSVTDQDKLMYEMRNGCSLRDANGGNVPVYYGNQFQPILAHTAYDKIIGPTVMPPASGYYSSRLNPISKPGPFTVIPHMHRMPAHQWIQHDYNLESPRIRGQNNIFYFDDHCTNKNDGLVHVSNRRNLQQKFLAPPIDKTETEQNAKIQNFGVSKCKNSDSSRKNISKKENSDPKSLKHTQSKEHDRSRYATRFNPVQNRILKDWYALNSEMPYASDEQVSELAKSTKLNEKSVRKWLSNKRSRKNNTNSLGKVVAFKKELLLNINKKSTGNNDKDCNTTIFPYSGIISSENNKRSLNNDV